MANISALVPSCLNGFRSLNDSLPALLPEFARVEDDVPEGLRPSLKNELGRFRVWVTNLGAHRTGRSSLDYRLRDASHIRTQVINLLDDLLECLQDGASIANGTVEPWDTIDPTSEDEDSDSDGSEPHAPSGLTELSQIVSEASEIINCLFRLSVSIHNPAPHDRFRRSAMTDTSHYEAFDTAHVENKFPCADRGVIQRLGKANSFRRQYFRYREEHHRKLAQGLPNEDIEQPGCDDTKTIGDTTVASSLPQHLKASNSDGSGFEDCDNRSEAGRTETSFAPSSTPDGSRSRMPSMPDEAEKGPFECPFCYRMISVETTKEWRKHVLGDLRPYICLYPDCSVAGQDFQRRHQWIQHVQQAHWKILLCPLGCKDLHIEDILALEAHIAAFHKEHAETLSPESLIQLSEQDRPLDASKKCELCDEELDSFKAYTRHVGRHQEDVALFVLPDRGLDQESLSDEQNEESPKAPGPAYDSERDGLTPNAEAPDSLRLPEGLPPLVVSPPPGYTENRLPSIVDTLGWNFHESLRSTPSQNTPAPDHGLNKEGWTPPWPAPHLPPLPPPGMPQKTVRNPNYVRYPDGSSKEPEYIPAAPAAPGPSYYEIPRLNYDDTQEGPVSKNISLPPLTTKRQWESDEPEKWDVTHVRNPNYVPYPDGSMPNGREYIPEGLSLPDLRVRQAVYPSNWDTMTFREGAREREPLSNYEPIGEFRYRPDPRYYKTPEPPEGRYGHGQDGQAKDDERIPDMSTRMVRNPNYVHDQRSGPEFIPEGVDLPHIRHRSPAAGYGNAQDGQGGTAHHESKARKRASEGDRGDDLSPALNNTQTPEESLEALNNQYQYQQIDFGDNDDPFFGVDFSSIEDWARLPSLNDTGGKSESDHGHDPGSRGTAAAIAQTATMAAPTNNPRAIQMVDNLDIPANALNVLRGILQPLILPPNLKKWGHLKAWHQTAGLPPHVQDKVAQVLTTYQQHDVHSNYNHGPSKWVNEDGSVTYRRPSVVIPQTLRSPREDNTRRRSPHERDSATPYTNHSKSDRGYDVIVTNPSDEDRRRRRALRSQDQAQAQQQTDPQPAIPPLTRGADKAPEAGNGKKQDGQGDEGSYTDMTIEEVRESINQSFYAEYQ